MPTDKPLFKPSGVINKPFKLAEDLVFILSNGTTMYVPKGYLTDFASVPSILKLFTNTIDTDASAFIIHDYLYNFAGYYVSKKFYKLDTDAGWVDVTRKFADQEMRFHMKKYGATKLRQWLYYIGVRIGGITRFNKI